MALHKIKHLLTRYLKTWWIPILSYTIPFVFLTLGNILRSDFIIDFSLLLFYANMLGNIISAIVQVVIKKWYWIIPQLGISAFLLFCLSTYFFFSPPDYYGAYKVIPDDIEIYEPYENEPSVEEIKAQQFIISQSSQPGIYNYYTSIQPKDSGSFYIKAYEITSNDRLSEERMTLRSTAKVKDERAETYKGTFTIYEGSWGDKYGARIELWFTPFRGDTTYKTTEKNYVVEGWMR